VHRAPDTTCFPSPKTRSQILAVEKGRKEVRSATFAARPEQRVHFGSRKKYPRRNRGPSKSLFIFFLLGYTSAPNPRVKTTWLLHHLPVKTGIHPHRSLSQIYRHIPELSIYHSFRYFAVFDNQLEFLISGK
jgi:hypothetical protein